ncbi:hypothetical protein DVH24_038003 [Malus domestica]|uniref:Uncharacterized protein n=1 Tax=Malus domestica TaxID=3750 RepID=A0A498K640_MALDO|nr:hypothetical protein DVH24_038003 [Malus domestica]
MRRVTSHKSRLALRKKNEAGSLHTKTTRAPWMQKRWAFGMQNDEGTSHAERGKPCAQKMRRDTSHKSRLTLRTENEVTQIEASLAHGNEAGSMHFKMTQAPWKQKWKAFGTQNDADTSHAE